MRPLVRKILLVLGSSVLVTLAHPLAFGDFDLLAQGFNGVLAFIALVPWLIALRGTGWVEGALRSTDLVLKHGFSLDPISEVYEREHSTTPSAAIKASYERRSTELIRQYIDAGFDPGSEGEPIDLTRVVPTQHEQYGVTLTYFDEMVELPGPDGAGR